MIVRVLGSAAGGGVPQWNCACVNCAAARSGRAPRRTQSSLAISRDGRAPWLLLNCSPDIAMQIEACSALHPRDGCRFTPIEDVLLTDANFDHIGGLVALRQASHRIRVRSSSIVKEIVSAQKAFAHFVTPPHRWLDVPLDALVPNDGDDDAVSDWLMVRTLGVPGATPGYDGRRAVRGAVVAYELIERGSNAQLLVAPVFGEIDDALGSAIERSKVAFLDGSFYSDDELEATARLPKTARAMGHKPVGGSDGTLARLETVKSRVIFTHINNSNPMLDPASDASASLRASGAEIAYDGMEVTL